MPPRHITSVLMLALAANAAATAATFTAALLTGSTAMLAAALLTLVAAANQGLLLLNISRAQQPADAAHPFGYAKELHFWSFVVAILLFSLAAGIAIHDGIGAFVDPRPVIGPRTAYLALGIAFVAVALATDRAVQLRRETTQTLRAQRSPVLFTVLTENFAALISFAVAFVGIAISDTALLPAADGAAATLIGLLLGAVAAIMSIEVRNLILGVAAPPEIRREIHEAIVAEVGPGRPIRAVNEIRTMHLGPRSLLVVASVDLEDREPAANVEAAVSRIEATLRERVPSVRRIFIEGQSATDYVATERAMEDRMHARPSSAEQKNAPRTASLLSTPRAGPDTQPEAPRPLNRKERKRQKHLNRR
ncbi:cation diffusion facilitator family transporter [Hyphomicrobium sp. CS1GBMeth3]|uniref:cation diffusion facilitator family transporter n=1 Tax=Hyphomicrobium sp. CS1GBMeth3 TaxID=1892845 RepID=UPI000A500E65|nr:cation diffusion facilitator family transporter [Hyphomicrobium sp. CS1GBMeth3]